MGDDKSFWTHLEEVAGSLPGGVKSSWSTNIPSILMYLDAVGFGITRGILEKALDDWSRSASSFPWLVIRVGEDVTFSLKSGRE